MNKITPFLWFDNQAEEAAKFYSKIFNGNPNSEIKSNYEKGTSMSTSFELENQKFIALNGGPVFKFNEAVSFFVDCSTQEEIDYFWENLSKGGKKGQCGWLKDKYGLSWQIVPSVLSELLSNPNKEKSDKVMKAMLKMQKLDISTLKSASLR